MKRFLFAAIVVIAALSLLAACSGEGDTTAKNDDAETVNTEDATTIADGSGEQRFGSDVYSLAVSATEEDGQVSGSGSIANGTVKESFTVECSAENGEIVMVGGTFDDGERAGQSVAFLIKDLNPDMVTIWFEERPADDCGSMLEKISSDVPASDMIFQPLEEGDFSIGG